jgi:hypothetical protein
MPHPHVINKRLAVGRVRAIAWELEESSWRRALQEDSSDPTPEDR